MYKIIWDENLTLVEIQKKLELLNTQRTQTAAYYTDRSIVTDIVQELPNFDDKTELTILEPSVGVGSFLWDVASHYDHHFINFFIVDINPLSILQIKELLKRFPIKNTKFSFINDNFLNVDLFNEKIDIAIGNPPFGAIKAANLPKDEKYISSNLATIFFEKTRLIADYVSLILPKSVLSAPSFDQFREYMLDFNIHKIIDFGENGFTGVKIETINLMGNNILDNMSKDITIKSWISNTTTVKPRNYIMDSNFPYWLIYRNDFFDSIAEKLVFDVFNTFRDRQITSKNTTSNTKESIWVLRSRNLLDDGKIQHIESYDRFISPDYAETLHVFHFLNKPVYIMPNLSYKPRSTRLPKNTLVDGSLALLIPKNKQPTPRQLQYYSSEEFRLFYRIARNLGTRSLNIDRLSVFFFGLVQ